MPILSKLSLEFVLNIVLLERIQKILGRLLDVFAPDTCSTLSG